MIKRIFDIVLAAVGLAVLAPLLGLIALAVGITSRRPILFGQRRVGRFGREFTMYKFRTMRVLPAAEQGHFEPGSQRRVTPIGRLLRRSKLDELPQLWNVLRGEMSLVGPRPEVRRWVDAYPERWAPVLEVRPGITDPAAIEFRNEEALLAGTPDPERTYREEVLPRKLALYQRYVRERSLWGDCVLIWRTLVTVLSR